MIKVVSSEVPLSPIATVDEAVVHMRLVDVDEVESGFIEGLILAATNFCEAATNRSMSVRVRNFELRNEGRCETLFYMPVYTGSMEVDAPSMEKIDDDGTRSVVPVNPEFLRRGYVHLSELGDLGDTFMLRVAMGPSEVDAMARAACLMLMAHWYEHREAVDDRQVGVFVGRTLNEVPLTVRRILELLRQRGV